MSDLKFEWIILVLKHLLINAPVIAKEWQLIKTLIFYHDSEYLESQLNRMRFSEMFLWLAFFPGY